MGSSHGNRYRFYARHFGFRYSPNHRGCIVGDTHSNAQPTQYRLVACPVLIRLNLAELPPNVGWRQLIRASFLAGIGFTMSLFIASAAFNDAALLAEAKLGILMASILAGIIGSVLSMITSPTHAETSHRAIAPATD